MHTKHTLPLVVALVAAGITPEVHAGDTLRLPAAQLLSAPSRDVSVGDIDRDGLVDVVLAPFRGGSLVPTPDLVIPLATDADGNLLVVIPWPAGLPTGAPLVWQLWIQDASGPAGFTSSNGLCQTLP